MHFTFEHHREYQQVQFKFLDAVESLDPNNIVVCGGMRRPMPLPPARAGEPVHPSAYFFSNLDAQGALRCE